MHKVLITSMSDINMVRLRFEVLLDRFDITMSRKLRLMGFQHLTKGTYVKELRNPYEMKDRYLFNLEFLNREFGKDNIQYYKYQKIVS